MAKKDKTTVNYAAPGATVGIQAGSVTIGGGIRLGEDVTVDGPVTAEDDG